MMRCCDVMLSFPSQIMILAIVGILGVGIFNVILANILVKWAWYTRMIRGIVIKHSQKNYILFSRASGTLWGLSCGATCCRMRWRRSWCWRRWIPAG